MTGWVSCIAPCIGCGQPFAFHPHRVPSVVVNGSREPICQSCVDQANPRRIAEGLEPIVPLPGAYEPCPEEEL